MHFWFYALLATPGVWTARIVGAPALAGFAATNLVLLGLALWVAVPRIGRTGMVWLMASPIVWWLDKAHTEVFTFSLLTIAFALVEERPWWSMVACGAAATQNPPIAIVTAAVFLASTGRRPSYLWDRRFIAGAAAGIGLALLHPIYTYWRHGTVSLLLSTTRQGLPTVAELSAVVLDPDMGLIGNAPLLLLGVAAGFTVLLVRNPRALASTGAIVASVSAVAFLYSFAQTANQHHGATPSLSRYAIWLIPLALPLLAALRTTGSRAWRYLSVVGAAVSGMISIFAFHPGIQENAHEPTWLAQYLWTSRPSADNPLPELFIEVNTRADDHSVPVATAGCEKVLLGGTGMADGPWPVPCYPAEVPATCARPRSLCYANRAGDRYEFASAPGRWSGTAPRHASERAWPAAAEPFVRQIYDSWGWHELPVRPEGLEVIRQVHGARASAIGHANRFLLILQDTEEGAFVMLRPDVPLTGVLLDAETGRTVRNLQVEPSADGAPVSVELPGQSRLLILALR